MVHSAANVRAQKIDRCARFAVKCSRANDFVTTMYLSQRQWVNYLFQSSFVPIDRYQCDDVHIRAAGKVADHRFEHAGSTREDPPRREDAWATTGDMILLAADQRQCRQGYFEARAEKIRKDQSTDEDIRRRRS